MSGTEFLSRSIRDRVAIVTGAGSGMGRETARLFAREGARVAVTDVNAAAVDEVIAQIRGESDAEVEPWTLDVSDGEAIKSVVEEVSARFGGIDILVNNAGISTVTPIDDDRYELMWERSLDVMLTGQLRLIRAALPHLRKSDAPRIVNIASTEGLGATARNSTYSVAKHGVVGLTRSLAVELGREAITVNCVCPGPIHTGMTEPIPDEAKEIFAKRRVALGRYGTAEEVAHMTLSLVLPAASFVTGVVVPVDGGLTVRNA